VPVCRAFQTAHLEGSDERSWNSCHDGSQPSTVTHIVSLFPIIPFSARGNAFENDTHAKPAKTTPNRGPRMYALLSTGELAIAILTCGWFLFQPNRPTPIAKTR
jgi:hypothetical protein